MMILVGGLLMWLLFCVSIAIVANQKGLDGGLWALTAVFLTPFFAVLLLIAVPDDAYRVKERQAKGRAAEVKRKDAMQKYVGKQAKKAEAANAGRVEKLIADNR